MGDSSHTGMLQLPECGAQTHRVGKGSREEAWEEGLEKVDTGRGRREAQRVSYCHWIGGGGGFTLPDLLKKKEKTKTKKPKHRVKLREQ